MKILLLNNNPVVNKLVTLSAQKTSNELSVAEDIEAIGSKNYDLLIVDDALYSEDIIQEISDKIGFNKSLYICSKDAKAVDTFTKTIKKPFLPTDLVELFISFGKHEKSNDLDKIDAFEDNGNDDVFENIDSIDDFAELDNIIDDALESDDEAELNDVDLDEATDDDMDLEELHELDELDEDLLLDEEENDGVLDKEELKEVKNLLDETEVQEDELKDDDSLEFDDLDLDLNEISDDLDDDLGLSLDNEDEKADEEESEDELTELSDELDQALDLEDDDSNEIEQKEDKTVADDFDDFELDLGKDDEEDDLDELDEVLDLEDDDSNEVEQKDDMSDEEDEELELDSDKAQEKDENEIEDFDDFEDFEIDSNKVDDELDNLESQIQSAVKELSDEDLESEIDEDVLLDIGSLTSRDLKLAIGEEVSEVADANEVHVDDEEIIKDNFEEMEITPSNTEANGVEAIEKLLKILSDEGIVASLKGKKININITIGDE